MCQKWAIACGALLLICNATNAASPYDDLAFALKQQQIIQSLRAHCHIDNHIPDEKIRNLFLSDKNNHSPILLAAKAFDKKDKPGYSHAIASVRCPEIK